MSHLICNHCRSRLTDKGLRLLTNKTFNRLRKMIPNVFRIRWTAWCGRKRIVSIHPDNIRDKEQLKFEHGWGCCGNAYKDFHCSSCNTVVGEQFLDCWQFGHVAFDFKKVELQHKDNK